MNYSEIELLLSTYSYCTSDVKNCNDCPWTKNKGECMGEEWSLKLYEVCQELLRTVENLHADVSEFQEDNARLEQDNKELTEENKNLSLDNKSYKSKLDTSIELNENLQRMLVAYKEVGKDQAYAIYYKDVRIAKLNAKLKALLSEEEGIW